MNFLEQTYLNNSVKTWLIAIGIAVVTYLFLRLLKAFVHRKAKDFSQKTSTQIDDLIADLIRRIKFLFLFTVSIFLGSQILALPETIRFIISKLLIIGFLCQGAIWGSSVFDYWLSRTQARKEEDDADTLTKYKALGFVVRLVLWSVVLLLALDNLGVDITALVTGLGVSGIAVALAVQNVLSDLFASMSIVMDKPFVIGDFIVVDDLRGTVEHIGLKTTRVKSLSGEQLIFSNSDLLSSRVRNYKRMEQRRIAFTIGVTYQTPAEKLAAIPGMIQGIIESQENVRFDRSHFSTFGDFSLNFDTVYYVNTPDYLVYMDVQQAINLALYKKFAEEGIEFAYPTQTVFVSREDA